MFIVVYVGYTTEMKHPWVSDHLMLGWYLFGGLVAILLFLDARFYRPSAVAESSATEAKLFDQTCDKSHTHYLTVTVLCAVLLLTGPAVVYKKNNQPHLPSSDVNVVLPAGAGDWHALSENNNSQGINIIEAITDIGKNVIQHRAITAALLKFN